MSADICLASLQVCLLDSEQRNTNGEQTAMDSAREMKWMQRPSFLLYVVWEEQCLFPSLLTTVQTAHWKAEEGEREVVPWCTIPSSELGFKGIEDQANFVAKDKLPTVFQ